MVTLASAQVPILNYSIDNNGKAQIEIATSSDAYYLLHVRHEATGQFEQVTAMELGTGSTITLTEPLMAYPIEQYQVTEHQIATPGDWDGDGIDDLTEFQNLGIESPFNSAPEVSPTDGLVYVKDKTTFKSIAFQGISSLDTALNNLEIVKFFISEKDEPNPWLYFINNNTHTSHTQFANVIGITSNPSLMTGLLVYHPTVVSPNGTPGVYRFFFQPNNTFSHDLVQKAMELIATNMPFLKNNLCYFPLEQAALPVYYQEQALYDASRVCVLFEADLFANVDYLALHNAEGYGLLRHMDINETPNSRDIVLYEALPNDLPRVGGIITAVEQTPLSHVNLRAIQDNVPNAFIRNALAQPDIDTLLDKYVYYKVEQAQYTIREATQQEVDDFYESIRPMDEQIPIRDLSVTDIKPLDDIVFEDSKSFGAKCANLATMRTFGFPNGTIPNGFGVPFYFYDEFMKYNDFYTKVQTMLDDVNFQSDFTVQIDMLKDFRDEIKDADMPQWMLDDLAAMQSSFPVGTSIRCRSSTNNEDLPGFSGAGLYDSKTQHPSEGHISKSIKQVFASMWNFRAFDERDFYRVNHFNAAMGILVHPNFQGEKANGVGVSTDPLYQTDNTYYLNTQVGEDLVTNPDALSFPEEILLDAVSLTANDYVVVHPSNQVPADTLVMQEVYLDQIRDYLTTIHDEFQVLYNAVGKDDFAMEIEYKITADDQLAIKQARPWASYWAGDNSPIIEIDNPLSMSIYPNPFTDFINIQCDCNEELEFQIFNLLGQSVLSQRVDFSQGEATFPLENIKQGVYFLSATGQDGRMYFSKKLLKL